MQNVIKPYTTEALASVTLSDSKPTQEWRNFSKILKKTIQVTNQPLVTCFYFQLVRKTLSTVHLQLAAEMKLTQAPFPALLEMY